MSNSFDNKIKEGLENFEMPYDAGAWAQLAEQLPVTGGAASGGSQFGWKAVAVIAVLVTTVATAWYMTDNKEIAETGFAPIERTEKVADKKKDAPVEVSINIEEEATGEITEVATPEKPEQIVIKSASEESTERKSEQLADEAKSVKPAHEDTQVTPWKNRINLIMLRQFLILKKSS